MVFAFEKLMVYKKSVDFADTICQRIEDFARVTAFSLTSSTAPRFPLLRISPKGTAGSPSPIEGISSGSHEARFKNACRYSNWHRDENC